jgi:hypothetical protein
MYSTVGELVPVSQATECREQAGEREKGRKGNQSTNERIRGADGISNQEGNQI